MIHILLWHLGGPVLPGSKEKHSRTSQIYFKVVKLSSFICSLSIQQRETYCFIIISCPPEEGNPGFREWMMSSAAVSFLYSCVILIVLRTRLTCCRVSMTSAVDDMFFYNEVIIPLLTGVPWCQFCNFGSFSDQTEY